MSRWQRLAFRAKQFDPRTIPGLVSWHDASDSATITVGTGVSSWADKSGKGYTLSQSTGNNQPTTGTRTIGGRNALDFDGSNDGLSGGFSLDFTTPKEFTVFAVSATDTTAAGYQPLVSVERTNATDYTSGFVIARRTTRPEIAIGDGRTSDSPAQQGTLIRRFNDDTTSAVVYAAYASASANTTGFWKNGSVQALATWYGTLAASSFLSSGSGDHRLTVGAGSSASADSLTEWFDGIVGEVLVYKSALSASQLSAVTRYLGKKWGIAVA